MIVCVCDVNIQHRALVADLSFHSHPTAHTFLGDYLTASAPQSVGYAEADPTAKLLSVHCGADFRQ